VLSLLYAFIATVFVFIMIFLAPSLMTAISLNDKLVVSGVFIASCCIGMSLAIYPGWIRRIANKEIHPTMNISGQPKQSFSGHHPDCEKFHHHRITIGSKTWCAGCLGLLLGALVSILLMILYTMFSPGFSHIFDSLLLLLGLVLVLVIYLEAIAQGRHAVTHLVFNGMLIPGFFLITMSVTELTGKAFFGVFTVLLCAVWLATRVTLSAWRHRSTCSLCKESCKMYAQAQS
jgi:uncharacterized membrane protein YciS (DUF1049 family)